MYRHTRTKLAGLVASIYCLASAHALTAATIHVPGDYPTIQAGIDAAVDGDEVVVADGVWTGPDNRDLDFGGRLITVRSANGPETCIINCGYSGRGFYFHSFETAEARVEGFTIRRGSISFGGGVYVDDGSSVTITRCIVLENEAVFGGGVAVEGTATILNCVFLGNTAFERGGGIFGSNASIHNCVFLGNSAGIRGGGFFGSGTLIINCTFKDNMAKEDGGALSADGTLVANCILWGNETPSVDGSVTIIYSDIEGGWPGEGNIDSDPQFEDGASGRIVFGSPCIDAGNNAVLVAGMETDLDGNPRRFDQPCFSDSGLGSPPLVDMGAYEVIDGPRSAPPPPSTVQASSMLPNVIEVQWEEADGALDYQVYRSTSTDPATSEGVSGWLTETIFYDAAAVPEQVYWYWIKARNGCGESDWSEPDSGSAVESPLRYLSQERAVYASGGCVCHPDGYVSDEVVAPGFDEFDAFVSAGTSGGDCGGSGWATQHSTLHAFSFSGSAETGANHFGACGGSSSGFAWSICDVTFLVEEEIEYTWSFYDPAHAYVHFTGPPGFVPDSSGTLEPGQYRIKAFADAFSGFDKYWEGVFDFELVIELPCPGDIHGDGLVGLADLLAVLNAWGPCPPGGPCLGDIDGDGIVGFTDLLEVINAWGPCP